MKTIFLIFALLSLSIFSVSAQESNNSERRLPRKHDPKNPTVHDPVMAKQGDTYYLFSTGMGIKVMSSTDMVSWTMEKPVFDKAPEWAVDLIPGFKGHIWAPDIIYHGGKYHLFYSCSAFGKNTSAIGHATTLTLNPDDPDFGWTDHGKLLQSVPERDSWNAIDPNIIIDDNGTPWMSFGSFWDGIKLVRLTDNMMSVYQPEEWHSISRYDRKNVFDNNPVEAPFIMLHNEYYYQFVSFDYCCKGLDSTYKIAVGRSKTVTGPYLDKENVSMARGGGSIVLAGNEKWAGVGHCAAYTFDGQSYLIAHGYDTSDNGTSKLIIRKIEWDSDGWPVVEW